MRKATSRPMPPRFTGGTARRTGRSNGSVAPYTPLASTRAAPVGRQWRANDWVTSRTIRTVSAASTTVRAM